MKCRKSVSITTILLNTQTSIVNMVGLPRKLRSGREDSADGFAWGGMSALGIVTYVEDHP